MRKFINKKWAYPVAIVAAMLAGGGAAYALTNTSFAPWAQNWANATCTQSLLNKQATIGNERTATICYNYYENQNQDSQISSINSSSQQLESQITTLSNHQEPTLLDTKNNVLGPLLSSTYGTGYSFYSSSLERIVSIDPSGNVINQSEGNAPIDFTSNNCTGQAYTQPDANLNLTINLIFGGVGYYYTTNTSTTSDVNVQSQLNLGISGDCDTGYTAQGQQLIPVSQVSIPFSDPVELPLSLSNQ